MMKHVKSGTRVIVALASALLVTGTFANPMWSGYVIFAQYSALPDILTFEKNWESRTYRTTSRKANEKTPDLINSPPFWPGEKSTIANLHENGRFGTLLHINPAPDWRQFRALSFTAASTTEKTHSITISIKDLPTKNKPIETRVGTEIQVGQTPVRHIIPFEQLEQVHGNSSIDFAHIKTLVLSASEPKNDVAILIDDVALER